MQNGEPSRTALGAARHRADHQKLDGASIFRDPLAVAAHVDGHPENAAASAAGGLVVAALIRGSVRAV